MAGARISGNGTTVASAMALVVSLVALCCTRINDLDIGFYLAIGRHVLAEGMPRTEFYLPLLPGQPFGSLHVLGSVLLTLAWQAGGPAGIVLLKLAAYGGGFVLVWNAARRRSGQPAAAALVVAAVAAAVAGRFVERTGMFSALLLGLMVWVAAATESTVYTRRRAALYVALVVVLSLAWSWTHAEWYLGLALLGVVLLERPWPWRARIGVFAAALLVPWASFALLHPAGIRAILSPLGFIIGGEAVDFGILEYSREVWRAMPGALAMVALMVPMAVWLAWRQRRPWHALYIGGLVLLCLKVPRAVLPLGIVGAPWLAAWVVSVLPMRLYTAPVPRAAMLAMAALLGPVVTALDPDRDMGLSMQPALDSRGIAAALDRIDTHEGPLLATFGLASSLLAHPAVVRQGVVMDGRQEVYTREYYNLYTTLVTTRDDAAWQALLVANNIGFYFERYPTERDPLLLVPRFRAIGWQIIAWDNSGRLLARPDIVRRHNLTVFRFDPVTVGEEIASPADAVAAFEESYRQAAALQLEGIAAPRPLTTAGRLALRINDPAQAAVLLREADRQGARRHVAWWLAMAEMHLANGDPAAAGPYIQGAWQRGAERQAALLRSIIQEQQQHSQ